jgi:hypothetical protein
MREGDDGARASVRSARVRLRRQYDDPERAERESRAERYRAHERQRFAAVAGGFPLGIARSPGAMIVDDASFAQRERAGDRAAAESGEAEPEGGVGDRPPALHWCTSAR